MKKIDKIIEYIDSKGGNYAEFERKAGISNAYIKNTSGRDAEIGNKILDKIRKNIPDEYGKIFGDSSEGDKNEGAGKKNIQSNPIDKDLSALIKSNADLAESNKALAYSHVDLVQMLKEKSTEHFSSGLAVAPKYLQSIIGHLKALVELDARERSEGDPKKFEEIMKETGRIIVEKSGVVPLKDSRKSSHHK